VQRPSHYLSLYDLNSGTVSNQQSRESAKEMFQSLTKRQIYSGQGPFSLAPKEKHNWCPNGTASIAADSKAAHVTHGPWQWETKRVKFKVTSTKEFNTLDFLLSLS